jgi:deazaflavin-dependent oxidoreductase (nitroreductase family)
MESSMPEKRFMALRKFNHAILNPITRSLTAGRFSFCSLVYHVGRISGKEYATPVKAVIKDGYIFIPLTFGADTDWCLNVQAAGFRRLKIEGKVYSASSPDLVDATAAAAAFPNNFRARVRLNQFLRLTINAES